MFTINSLGVKSILLHFRSSILVRMPDIAPTVSVHKFVQIVNSVGVVEVNVELLPILPIDTGRDHPASIILIRLVHICLLVRVQDIVEVGTLSLTFVVLIIICDSEFEIKE